MTISNKVEDIILKNLDKIQTKLDDLFESTTKHQQDLTGIHERLHKVEGSTLQLDENFDNLKLEFNPIKSYFDELKQREKNNRISWKRSFLERIPWVVGTIIVTLLLDHLKDIF